MKDILGRAKKGKRLALFLDYDGTLVPIRKIPELAILRPSRRRILGQLSRKAFVAIVSGRALSDIRRQVGIPSVAYIGNHGFEISYRERRWVHPEAKRRRKELKNILSQLRLTTKNMPGVMVEDKNFTGSVHFRLLAGSLVQELKEIVLKMVRLKHRELVLTEGKKVFEIRPRVKWDKGKGVLELCRWLPFNRTNLRIYVGDDQTDEYAFKALRRSSLSVAVGRKRSTNARYRLPDVNAVWKLLRALLAVTDRSGSGSRGKRRAAA